MPTAITNAITDISGLISKASEKANAAEQSRHEANIQGSLAQAAEARVESSEAEVERQEALLDSLNAMETPTKTVSESSGGCSGGMQNKEVEDTAKKNELMQQKRQAEVQAQQAKAAVEAAREEAEEARTNSLQAAGVTEQHQQDMNSLTNKIDDLQKLANNDDTDLLGSEFQDQLKDTKEHMERLYEELPDTANAVLQDFWEDVGEGFTDIQNQIVDFITPDPSTIDSDNNYEGFFNDAGQGFDKVLGYLEGQGVDQAVLSEVRNSKDSIVNEKNTDLRGMTADDDLIMQGFLTHLDSLGRAIDEGLDLTMMI